MTAFYMLPAHVASCLDIPITQLKTFRLPRAGHGVSADAVVRTARFAAIQQEIEALRRQAEQRRLEAPGRDRAYDAGAREAMLDRRAMRKRRKRRQAASAKDEDILAKKRWRQRARRLGFDRVDW